MPTAYSSARLPNSHDEGRRDRAVIVFGWAIIAIQRGGSMRSLGLKLLLAATSLLLVLLAAEGFVRASKLRVYFEPTVRDYYAPSSLPGVRYALKPGIDAVLPPGRITSNVDGLRTRHLPAGSEGGEGVYRILALGDSLTFGFGVDQRDAYPQILEQMLNAAGEAGAPRYEVVNGGIDGYNALDAARLLEALLPRYRPDLVVWLLVQNDWDDPLGVDREGRLDWSQQTAATSQWLELGWGWSAPSCDPANFLPAMDPASRAWARGTPRPPPAWERLDGWLRARSASYALLRNRLAAVAAATWVQQKMDDERVYKNYRVESQQGVDHLPETPAIRLSPYFEQRFYAAIERGVAFARGQSVPVQLLGLNVPFDPARLETAAPYQDVTQYFGFPFERFRSRYSLGWDPHPSPRGNRLLAQSVLRALKRWGHLPEVSAQDGEFYDKGWYWKRYADYRDDFIARHIAAYVDFERFQNLHQLVGGLLPPRLFPLASGRPVAVILKRDGSQILHIAGVNRSQQARDLGVEVGVDRTPQRVRVDRGAFEIAIQVQGLDASSNELVDVRLRSLSEPFEAEIRLHYLGFVPRSEKPPMGGLPPE